MFVPSLHGKNLCQLVKASEAAVILGVKPGTLKKYRLAKDSSLIPGIHYHLINPRVVRYHPELLLDWFINQQTPELHQQTIELYLSLVPSNQPKCRGRRAK